MLSKHEKKTKVGHDQCECKWYYNQEIFRQKVRKVCCDWYQSVILEGNKFNLQKLIGKTIIRRWKIVLVDAAASYC